MLSKFPKGKMQEKVMVESSLVRPNLRPLRPEMRLEERFQVRSGFHEFSLIAKRSIKPLVLSGRNWFFTGSEEGGQTAATIMSLIETCKRLGINPIEYMKDLLTRFPSAKTSEIDIFLPERWLACPARILITPPG